MAYELLAGHPPFFGLAPHKLMQAHMGETPRPVEELRPDCPPALARLIARCLANTNVGRINPDTWWIGPAHKRLGELCEARGDAKRAAEQYAAFVELWKHADPELQPRVAEARARLEHVRRLLPH